MGHSEPHLLCFPHGSPWVRTSKEIFSVLLLHSLSCFSSLHCLVFTTASFNLFPPKLLLQTHKCNSVPSQPCLFQTDFLLPPRQSLSHSDTSVSSGSQEKIPPFLNTTRKGRREAHHVPVLTFPRHDLLARVLQEGIVISILQDEGQKV